MADESSDELEPETYESWDAFWSEVEGPEKARTETIRGIEVRVPTGLTVRLARRFEQLQNSSSMDDITSLLADLYSTDAVEAWIAAGMELLEFQTVMAWSVAQAGGNPITFREALRRIREFDTAKTAAAGKARRRRAHSTR
jgi:hypothetical protein